MYPNPQNSSRRYVPFSYPSLPSSWTKTEDENETDGIDYLLKLKPRHYPSSSPSPAALDPSKAKGEGGTYLTPSLVNRSEPGRSYYLTAHREVISRIHEPGTFFVPSISDVVPPTSNVQTAEEKDHI